MRLRELTKGLRRTGHLMVGISDYDHYITRRTEANSHESVMSLSDFQRHCAERRFSGGDKGISRCC